MSAWKKLSSRENSEVWDRFEDEFRFRPSTKADKWPSIVEPRGSSTYSIAHVLRGGDRKRLLDVLHRAFRRALQRRFIEGSRLLALDWQHDGYWLDPHKLSDVGEPWPISLVPDGDYHIFLTEDFREGVFGHPWEETICVFGRLVEELRDTAPRLFSPSREQVSIVTRS